MSDTSQPNRTQLQQMEDTIRAFEEDAKWRVSVPARIVLQQGFLSLSTDRIGLIGLEGPVERRFAQREALDGLRPFLDEIGRQADRFVEERGIGRNEAIEIGAIFMMQHINLWAIVKKCGCYPQ
jgi:hypothetical protein